MSATKTCKICGAEYEYCHTNAPHQFRWQDVACSKEHAALYFAQIAESRGQSLDTIPKEYTDLLPQTETKSIEAETVATEPVEAESAVVENETINVALLGEDEIDDVIETVADFTSSKKKSKKKLFGY